MLIINHIMSSRLTIVSLDPLNFGFWELRLNILEFQMILLLPAGKQNQKFLLSHF